MLFYIKKGSDYEDFGLLLNRWLWVKFVYLLIVDFSSIYIVNVKCFFV